VARLFVEPAANRPARHRSAASCAASVVRRLDLPGLRLERKGDRVHAVAVTGRGLRGVIEDVAEVRVAGRAPHLRAHHPVRPILDQRHRVRVLRVVERRPAAVRVELRLRPEQLAVTRPAPVDADPLLVEQRPGPRPLGRGLPQYGVLLRRKIPPPLVVRLLDAFGHSPIVPWREPRRTVCH